MKSLTQAANLFFIEFSTARHHLCHNVRRTKYPCKITLPQAMLVHKKLDDL